MSPSFMGLWTKRDFVAGWTITRVSFIPYLDNEIWNFFELRHLDEIFGFRVNVIMK